MKHYVCKIISIINGKIYTTGLTPIHQDRTLEKAEFDNLYPQKTQRGQGAYGSTGHI